MGCCCFILVSCRIAFVSGLSISVFMSLKSGHLIFGFYSQGVKMGSVFCPSVGLPVCNLRDLDWHFLLNLS